MAPKGSSDSEPPPMPQGGMMDYYARGGTGSTRDILKFLGQEDMLGNFYAVYNSGGGGGSAATFGETQMYKDIMAYLTESASSEPDFSKFDFSKYGSDGDDNTKKALSYKKQYRINKDIQMAETVLSEALLETTNYGQILQYSRKALVKIYGAEDEKSINTVYSVLVGKLDFYKKTLSRKADNPVYNTIVAGIITTLGANTLRLEVKNEYILHQIKKMDIDVYRTIFPEYTTSRFGGGGAKGKW